MEYERNKGWDKLEDIAEYAAQVHNAKIVQIKEKFGYLRIYVERLDPAKPMDKAIHEVLLALENASGKICERCGTTENVTHGEMESGWLKTYCKNCRLTIEAERSKI